MMPLQAFAQRAARFGAVSALCSGLNILVLTLGDQAGLHYALSILISFAICVVVGYVAHARFSFDQNFTKTSFIRYVAAMLMNIPVSLIAVWLLHDMLHMPILIAATLATLITILYNYISSQWAIAAPISHNTPSQNGSQP
jgi:putative flippase GtrA